MRRVVIYEQTASEKILLSLRKIGKGSLDILLGPKLDQKERFQKSLQRLRKRNLIFGERRGKRVIFALTDKGTKEAKTIKLKLEMAKRNKWDGKWRIIIFDIPEKLRGKRDFLRQELNHFGFMQLQRSVWGYPYKLPQEFVDLWKDTGIFQHCIILEVVGIENSARLKDFYFPKT